MDTGGPSYRLNEITQRRRKCPDFLALHVIERNRVSCILAKIAEHLHARLRIEHKQLRLEFLLEFAAMTGL
jgi:hypothetical protein